MFHRDQEGPPCSNMENLLQQVADGSAKGLKKWYAVAHANQCTHCGNFLSRMTKTVSALRSAQKVEDEEVVNRLLNGSWKTAVNEATEDLNKD